ncbi:MAG TPA: tetratricopeptide repeat protein [Bryobacteraceae bacterium]|nr:tetratricopeptide repeat protein [Bryobacteraceae bacterium]
MAACAFAQQQQPPAGAPGGNQLDANEALFTVMVALNAAGYNADADSPTNSPLRREIRDFFVTQRLDSLNEIRGFMRDHHQANPYAEYSQYVSLALTLGDPPNFSSRYDASALPPDVQRLDGFTPLLAAFYREAHVNQLWRRAQPVFDNWIARLQPDVARAVLQVNAYLRNQTSGYLGRRFQIYVDLLGPPNQVQMRSYIDDFYVVVTPATDLPIQEIRHGYMHYLLDPLPIKFSQQLSEKHALGDYALGSPILDDQYKTDFILLTTECFIKAVESRIDRKPALVDLALREGFVLTPVLAEQLELYEKQDVTMRLYFPAIVDGIDLKREEQRLDHIDFASEKTVRTRAVTREVGPPPPVGVEKTLADAEDAYRAKDYPRSKNLFLSVMQQTDKKPLHAKAYYGLARISALERDPESADRLFRKALELDPDPETKAWSLLYLGRLADSQGRHDEAVEQYKAALAVAGAPDSVREAAQKGLKQAFVKKN